MYTCIYIHINIYVYIFFIAYCLLPIAYRKAMRTVREDKDVMLAAGIRDLFMTTPDPSDWRKMKSIEDQEEVMALAMQYQPKKV